MNKPRLIIIIVITALFITITAVHHTQSQTEPSSAINPITNYQLQKSFGQLPLLFVQNQGQWDDQVAFAVQGSDKTLYFTPDGVTLALTAPIEDEEVEENPQPQPISRLNSKPTRTERYTVKLDFLGANPNVRPIGEQPDTAIISYFKGQPHDWHTGLSTYRRIIYPDLWPGIDLIYEGTVNRLKYHFLVHPGADPNKIRLAYRGAESVTLNEAGQLTIQTPLGSFTDDTPVAYQEIDGEQVPVDMAYVLEKETAESQPYHFSIGNYDPTLPLILDPVILIYSGYIGGSLFDFGVGIEIDDAGNAYITGYTNSTDTTFPVTVGPDLTYNGMNDAFIVKVNSAGTGLVYAGYIGGSDDDFSYKIEVDTSGNAYIVGGTSSSETTFPVIVGPDLTFNGDDDAFVAKVNPTGTGLVYSGYIGGVDTDFGADIALDSSGNLYVTGSTLSNQTTFPVTVGPDLTYNGNDDAFVAKVNAAGSGLIYAGYIGGSNEDQAEGVSVDNSGNAYITGYTLSSEATFPVTIGPDLTFNGQSDAFVTKVNTAGNDLIFSGFIGGSLEDYGHDIVVDQAGSAHIIGYTNSTETTFPVTVGPDLTANGGYDSFTAKIDSTGTGLEYAGYIGGSNEDIGYGIALDNSGNTYVTGDTQSSQSSFPVVNGPDLTYNGLRDVFVAKVDQFGIGLNYAGYIGGSAFEYAYDIAVDSAGSAYVTGYTASTQDTFPVVVGPDLTWNGETDAFITKVSPEGPSIAPDSVVIDGPVTGVGGTGYTFTATTAPLSTTVPLTYVWQATNQQDVTQIGSLANTAVLTWTTPGPKTITVTASNTAGTVTNTHTITIYEAVLADFTAAPTTGNTPLAVTFTNLSTGSYTTCLWDFGDGGTSAACNPTHQYTTPGLYTISLTISGPGGTDTHTKTNHITVTPTIYLPILLKP